MKNQYISIEGLEGAGKTTASNAIFDFLKNNNINENIIQRTREPGGTPLAEMCRDFVKNGHPDEELCDDTEVMMLFSARSQLLNNVIIPAMKEGKFVISDRCYLSTIAYQRKEKELVNFLLERIQIRPNLIILLDVTPEIGLKRARGRGELDRIEKKDITFFNEAREKYLSYAKENHDFVKIINADETVENVYKAVYSELERFYN